MSRRLSRPRGSVWIRAALLLLPLGVARAAIRRSGQPPEPDDHLPDRYRVDSPDDGPVAVRSQPRFPGGHPAGYRLLCAGRPVRVPVGNVPVTCRLRARARTGCARSGSGSGCAAPAVHAIPRVRRQPHRGPALARRILRRCPIRPSCRACSRSATAAKPSRLSTPGSAESSHRGWVAAASRRHPLSHPRCCS